MSKIETALDNLLQAVKAEQEANGADAAWNELWASLRKRDGLNLTSVKRIWILETLEYLASMAGIKRQ